MSDWTDDDMDELIRALALTSDTAVRIDNDGLDFETNGYVPESSKRD